MSFIAANTPGCTDFGSAARTFACTWNQHRCSRVVGNTLAQSFPKPERPIADREVPVRTGAWQACGGRGDGPGAAAIWAARGVDPGQEYRYQTLLGWRLVEYVDTRSEPTGVAVDISKSAPMAFPPE